MHRSLILSLILLITASYAFAVDVTIHDIQFTTSPSGDSPYKDSVVTTGGIVTGASYSAAANKYFIADRAGGLWSGVYVFDGQSRTLQIGDSVHFQCTVGEPSSQTRLSSIVSFTSQPSVGTVPPVIAATGSVNESTEGVLIELQNATVISVNGTTSFLVNDGSGDVTISRSGWTFQHWPHVGDVYRFIHGIVSSSGTTYTVNPRGDLDFGYDTNMPPIITNVARTPSSPTVADVVKVTATITDDSTVAGASVLYRFSEEGDFSTQAMYDDGTHSDSASGDNIWTGLIPAGPLRATCSYYISAYDNANAIGLNPETAPDSTYSYIIRSTTISIFDLNYTGNNTGGQSPYVGQTLTVTGIITGTNYGSRASFFLSDSGGGPWSGILCYAPPSAPDTGSVVRVTGLLTEYNGTTEFSPTSQVTYIGTSPVPPPCQVTASVMPSQGEPYEGALIRIGRCVVTGVSSFVQYGEFEVNDGTGTCTIVTAGNYSFALPYSPAVGDSFTHIIGCGAFYSNVGWEIVPRYDSDLGLIDKRPPRLNSAFSISEHQVNVQISEAVQTQGISDLSNYLIKDNTLSGFPELNILSVTLLPTAKTLQIEVSESLIDTHMYMLVVDTLRDLVGNALIQDTVSFQGFRPDTLMRYIYDNFDLFNGLNVTLRGVVNFVQDVTTTSGSRRISAFMQDNSGRGFSLSQTGPASSFPSIKRGNLISITGMVSPYSGTIQLGSFSEATTTLLSEGVALPDPIVLKTGDLYTQRGIINTSSAGNYGAGTWCKIFGTVYRVDENVGGGTNIYVDDGSGSTTLRLWDSMNLDSVYLYNRWYKMRELAGVSCGIAGVSSNYNGDFQMLIGYAEDFTDTELDTLPSEGIVLDVPNRPFAPEIGQTLKIFYNAPVTSAVRLRVFNMRGQLVTTLRDKTSGGPDIINWDGRDELRNFLPMGTYILHFEAVANGKSDVKMKPIVVGAKL